ncbi:MAG: class I SAM-dependent methyltransferase [bacterium]|nr:class I SAM-dependent methyltransferase [Gammaproteobacteria bacterium]
MAIDYRLAANGAENFDRWVRIMMAPFVDPILQRVNLEEGKSVLDIGCGTGFFTRAARKEVGRTGKVIGLDPNGGMLEVAAALSAGDELSIEWCEASVEDMPLDNLKFDAVISTQTIMFFPDLEKGIRKICAVMASKGRVSVSFFAGPMDRSPYMAAYTNRLEEILPGTTDLVRHAYRLDGEEVATIFRNSGLKAVKAEILEFPVSLPPVINFLPLHIAYLPVAPDFAALDKSIQESFYTSVASDLAGFVQPQRNLLVPLALHVVSGQHGATELPEL